MFAVAIPRKQTVLLASRLRFHFRVACGTTCCIYAVYNLQRIRTNMDTWLQELQYIKQTCSISPTNESRCSNHAVFNNGHPEIRVTGALTFKSTLRWRFFLKIDLG